MKMQILLSIVGLLLAVTRLSRTQVPALAYMLEESYTINPDILPRIKLCFFNGQPTPNVTWTFEGNSLPTSQGPGGDVYFIPGDGTLVLEQASSRNSGLYTCEGTNIFGSATASTRIIISRRRNVQWYYSWYMWFVYAIIIWGLSLFFFIGWFCNQKKKAEKDLPPPDGWIGN